MPTPQSVTQPENDVRIIRSKNRTELARASAIASRASAIANVVERLEYFSARPADRQQDVHVRRQHAEQIVDAVLALTRTERAH